MNIKWDHACILAAMMFIACGSERIPDTQYIQERDSIQKMMDTMPDVRPDTVAINEL